MNQKKSDRGKFVSWIFIPTLVAIVIQTAVSIMALEFFIVEDMAKFKSGTYTDLMAQVINELTSDAATAGISIAYAIITAIFAALVFRTVFREGKLATLKGKSKNLPYTIVGMLLFTVAMQYVTTYLLNAFASAFPSWLEEYNELMDSAGISNEMTVAMTLYTIVLGPVCEELLFRGITFSASRKVMPYYFAILVQAIMFGAFHMNKLQGLYAFVLGLGLGYIMYLYDNLWITIAIHMLYNLLGTLLSDLLPVPGNTVFTFFFGSLASLIVAYGSIIFLRNGAASVNNDSMNADI